MGRGTESRQRGLSLGGGLEFPGFQLWPKNRPWLQSVRACVCVCVCVCTTPMEGLSYFWPKESEGGPWGHRDNEKVRDYPEKGWPKFCAWTPPKSRWPTDHTRTRQTHGSLQLRWRGVAWELSCRLPQVRQRGQAESDQVDCVLKWNNQGHRYDRIQGLDYITFPVSRVQSQPVENIKNQEKATYFQERRQSIEITLRWLKWWNCQATILKQIIINYAQ